jgi:cytochrome oxidase assembly protein ShyY1
MSARARVLLTVGFLATAAVCARLGVWQVHRLRERRAANAVAQAA